MLEYKVNTSVMIIAILEVLKNQKGRLILEVCEITSALYPLLVNYIRIT